MNDEIVDNEWDFCHRSTQRLIQLLNTEKYSEAKSLILEKAHLINVDVDLGQWRPLDVCISQGIRIGTEILVLMGADTNYKNRLGFSPAPFALDNGFRAEEHTYRVLSGEVEPRSLDEIMIEVSKMEAAYREFNKGPRP